MGKQKESDLSQIFSYLHHNIQSINNSKMFAGLMIITLNVVSRFVNIKLSKTMESYLKFTFSKQILVFAIAWMGTRDIYIALLITCLFVLFTEYLFHEESALFVLPEEFTERHLDLLEKDVVTEEEIIKAKSVLEKAKKQNKDVTVEENFQGYSMK